MHYGTVISKCVCVCVCVCVLQLHKTKQQTLCLTEASLLLVNYLDSQLSTALALRYSHSKALQLHVARCLSVLRSDRKICAYQAGGTGGAGGGGGGAGGGGSAEEEVVHTGEPRQQRL
jgi:hypothetical protein